MQSMDLEVLSLALRWLRDDLPIFLCTVVKTWGSSPRPVGSLLCCNADGKFQGSLSGGCVEDDLIEKLTKGEVASHTPELVRYGVTAEEAEKFGLPCGGSLGVLVEPLQPGEETIEHFDHLLESLKARQCCLRLVDASSGKLELRPASRVVQLVYDESDPERPVLRHPLGPKKRLLIIGAGIISRYLAEIAQMLDYLVVVCDPREELLAEWSQEGVQKTGLMPDDAVTKYADDEQTAIVALTHDPRIDDMAMMEALGSRAFYVGAIGSERTSAKRRERLRELDVSKEQLARLRAPVGLPVGSKTPPEIAVSIIAEIIAVQKQRDSEARALIDSQRALIDSQEVT